MALSMYCNNNYIDNAGKKKRCGQMEPYMDPKTEIVYCSFCDGEVPNITHFMKSTMKTLKQFKQKPQVSFAVKCKHCNKEARPELIDENITCPSCHKTHDHLSEPFKIMLREKLKTVNKDI